MAWTGPRTWLVGEIPDGAVMNTHLRDNLNYLFGATIFDATGLGNFDTGAGTIDQGYKHLLGIFYTKCASGASWTTNLMALRFNNDSAANYTGVHQQGANITASVQQQLGVGQGLIGRYGISPTGDAGGLGSFFFVIPNYTSTVSAKTCVSRWACSSGTSAGEQICGSATFFWNSTAAITRVASVALSTAPTTGSRFSLYGML